MSNLSAVANVTPITAKREKAKPIKLTATVINKSLARASRYDISDSVIAGFKLRVSPSGNKKFIATGRVRGTSKARTLTIGDADIVSLDEARRSATEFLSKIQLGIDATQVKQVEEQAKADKANEQLAKKITLQKAMLQYLDDRKLKPSTRKSYEYEIPFYCSEFLDNSIQDLTEDEICEWYLKGAKTPTSIDKAFRSLKAILQYMVGLRIITFNPCEAVNIRKIRYQIKARTRRIETHNITNFIDSWIDCMGNKLINPIQGDFILFLLMTGLRLEEARTLKWENLDYKYHSLTINETKNGHSHTLPFTPLMSDLLERRKKDNTERCPTNPFVFPARQGRGVSDTKHLNDCRKALDKIAKEGGLPIIRPHDVRRSFASILEELNISESNIKALMNHQDGTVTRKHYIQSANLETKRANLHKVACYLEESATINGYHPDPRRGNERVVFACENAIRDFIYGTSTIEPSVVKGEVTATEILESMR